MSQARKCHIFKAVDGKWYMILGDREYAYEEHECTNYGPYDSEHEVHDELEYHANPGSYTTDDSGTKPVPSNPIKPKHNNPFVW
jgi:hypothetical protein